MPSDQQIAAQKVLLRRRVSASLTEWARLNGYEPARHHKFLIEHLEAVVRGEINRLAIFLPPGSAKSTYSSVLFPPWFLAQRARASILVASHSDNLAESFGRRARNLVALHSPTLGYALRSDSKAAGEWNTTNGGLFFSAGIGTKVAGHRFHLGLVDDPIGKKEDADSKLIRDKGWDWYNYDFLPRQEPKAAVVVIQTRWHEDDLAGRILSNEKGWTVISIPLIAGVDDPLGRAPNESLWPEYFTAEQIEKARVSPAFSSLYQQTPTPDSGDYFKREWIVDAAYAKGTDLPSSLTYYAGSDHAVSQREESDRTCLIPAGVDEQGDLWILPDVWWPRNARPAPDEVVAEMHRLTRAHRFIYWWAGKDHITASLRPYIERVSREELVFIPFEELSEARDKQTKAQSIRAMFRQGRVHLPAFAEWYGDAVNELLRFDKGVHDDFVDAMAKLGRGLAEQHGTMPRVPVIEKLAPPSLTLEWVKASDKAMNAEENMAGVGM